MMVAAVLALTVCVSAANARAVRAQSSPPEAPLDAIVNYDARLISWRPAPEDAITGYKVTFTVIGQRENHVALTAEGDASSVTIPDDAPRLYCGARLEGQVVAFNDAGDSPPAALFAVGTCPGPPPPAFAFRLADATAPGMGSTTLLITWTAAADAESVLLGGLLRAVPEKIPASCAGPFSSAPIQHITLDAEIVVETGSYEIALPRLAADERYSIVPNPFDITFLDAYGEPLAGTRRVKIVEGCGLEVGQPSDVTLPSTGFDEKPNDQQSAKILVVIALALALAGALTLDRGARRR